MPAIIGIRRPCGSVLAVLAVIVTPAPAARAQEPPAAAPAAPATLPMLGLDPKDFAPMAGSVEWPTVESTADAEPPPAAASIRYTVEVVGLDPLGLADSFRRLSVLKANAGDETNIAQINRRSAEDRDLIDQLLRSVGHYGGNTVVKVNPPATANGPSRVVLTVDPGPLYTFASVNVVAPADATGPAPAEIVKPWLGVAAGDPVDALRVTTAQEGLAVQIADAGFPFPVVGKPDIVIDHATRTATLVQTIDLGPRGVFGTIRIEGEAQGMRDSDVARLARFGPGDPYNGALRDDLRRAMIHTTLFGTVSIRPVAAGTPTADGTQVVDLVVTTEAAPTRTVSASGGYSTGQGLRLEGSWTNRNMFPPQGALTFRGIAAEREQVVATEFRRSDWKRRDQTLTLRTGLSAEQQDAFNATTFEVSARVDRVSNLNWQKPWTYALGSEFLVTRQRDRSAPNDPNNTFFILAFPGIVTWDRSDNLLDPTRGFRLTGRLSPELTLRSGSYLNYVKAQFEGTGYLPFGDFVLAGRLHVGSIIGASRGRIAPDRRFYAGGGGSVRGFNFQGVGPRADDGTPTGGNSLTEASVEGRYRFQAFGNDLGVVAFLDAGNVDQDTVPGFNNLRFGAGIGVRYFTSFGPVRIDIATPINRQVYDPKIAFYVSIGQAF
nr:BamA/TamA family outer membrane protein [Polymorphobacter fuscus]